MSFLQMAQCNVQIEMRPPSNADSFCGMAGSEFLDDQGGVAGLTWTLMDIWTATLCVRAPHGVVLRVWAENPPPCPSEQSGLRSGAVPWESETK